MSDGAMESPVDESSARSRRWGRARRVLLVAGALGLIALIVLALSGVGFSRIGDSLASVNFAWLAAAIGLDAISMFLRAVSWQAVLRAALPEAHIAFRGVVRATMVGVMASAIVPGRVGEPARAWLVARRTGDARRSFSVVLGTVFSQTLLNLIALAILAGITFASVALFRGHESAVVAVVVVPCAIALLVLSAPRLLAIGRHARWPRVRRATAWVADEFTQMRRGLRVFADGRHGAVAAAAQLAAWAIQTLAVYAVLLSLHLEHDAGLAAAAAILLAVNVTAVVPVTPSNVGVFQAACVAVLAAYGVSAGSALAYGILLQGVEVATAIMLGVPALLGEGISWRELRHRAPGPAETLSEARGRDVTAAAADEDAPQLG